MHFALEWCAYRLDNIACVTHIIFMKQVIDIRKFRKDIGWSQEKLADELGVDRSSVSRWENNKSSLRRPVIKVLEQLIGDIKKGRAA